MFKLEKMNTTQIPLAEAPMPPITEARLRAARYYHTAVSAVLIMLMLVGFHHFYLEGRAYPGRELTPPIKTLIILHGVSMAAWMLLFLVQPILIATSRKKIHMKLGKLGAVFAVLVVIFGFQLGVESTRVNPPEMMIWGLTPRQFMAVPIISILLFGGLVTAAIIKRKQPEFHRALMLLATLAAMPAAISRIDAISTLYQGTVWEDLFGPFFGTHVVAFLFLLLRWALTQKLDRVYAVGCAGLMAVSAMIMGIATTGTWDTIAGMLLGQ